MVAKLTVLMVRGIAFANVALVVLVCTTGALIVIGAMDRRAPFAIHPHERIPVCAGQIATIEVPVMRDMSRPCDASYSRFLFDANEYRVDLSMGFVPFEEIRKLNDRHPGRLRVKVPIPPMAASGVFGGISAGHGRISSELEYVCNKGHVLYPIKVHTDILVDIRQCF